MPVNDIWQVTAYYTDGPEAAQVVRHWKVTAYSSATVLETATALLTELGPLYDAMLEQVSTATTALVCLAAQRVGATTSRIYSSYPVAYLGTRSGEGNAAQLAALVSLYTAILTASGRGRMYLPFPAESISNSGVLTAGAHATISPTIVDLLTPLVLTTNDELDPVVYSRLTSTANKIDDAALRYVLATQRGRRNPIQAVAP